MADIRSLLQEVHDRYGRLNPQLLVEEARPEESPLHGLVFDCGVAEASERYYLQRAHKLIQSVRIEVRKPSGESIDVRAFMAVQKGATDNGGWSYEPAEKIAQDPFLLRLVMQGMERDWRMMQERYGRFSEFADMVRRDIAS